jgi:hypothetical protein
VQKFTATLQLESFFPDQTPLPTHPFPVMAVASACRLPLQPRAQDSGSKRRRAPHPWAKAWTLLGRRFVRHRSTGGGQRRDGQGESGSHQTWDGEQFAEFPSKAGRYLKIIPIHYTYRDLNENIRIAIHNHDPKLEGLMKISGLRLIVRVQSRQASGAAAIDARRLPSTQTLQIGV